MLGIIFFVYFNFSQEIITNEIKQKAMGEVKNVIKTFEGFVRQKANVSWTINQNPAVKEWIENNTARWPDERIDPQYKKLKNYFLDIMAQDPDISFVFLASEKTGMYYEPTERPMPDDYEQSLWNYINTLEQTNIELVDVIRKYVILLSLKHFQICLSLLISASAIFVIRKFPTSVNDAVWMPRKCLKLF